jgi:ankyrin repeat protein
MGYGADATIVGSQGTPQQVATQGGQTEIAKLLLDHVVKLAQRGSSVESRAMSDLARRMFDIVKKGNLQEFKQFLIDFKTKVKMNERDDTGRTLLHIGAEEGHLSTVLHLVDKLKFDVNAQDRNGWTGLHGACNEGKLDVVEFLLRRGAAAGAITANHNTPLHYFARVACTAGSSELYHRVLKRLVEGGCEVNQQNVLGESALHLASFRARKECVAFLLDNDAQTNLRNKWVPHSSSIFTYFHCLTLLSIL